MELLDGKAVSAHTLDAIRETVAVRKSQGMKAPHLAAILVGNDGASETYVGSKVKTCNDLGFGSTLLRFDTNVTETELIRAIESINNNPEIDGLIVQSPLPDHISFTRVTEAINPAKDVDGFHPVNAGKLMQNIPGFIAATPKGILLLMEHYKIQTAGKHCVVIGRSNIIGMPMSVLMARNNWPGNCTVTICHSKTTNLKSVVSDADLVIAALGRPGFVTADMIKDGATVIDVGITRIPDESRKSGFRLGGDVDFAAVAPKCAYITPVPGGVGPMTIAGLMHNTLLAAQGTYYPSGYS